MGGDRPQPGVDALVGLTQQVATGRGQGVADAPAVTVVGCALDQAARHQAVDDRGDGGPAHRQVIGQLGGDGGAFIEEHEDAVLRQRQVDLAQADLHLAGQARRHPAVDDRHRSWFTLHMVRVSNS